MNSVASDRRGLRFTPYVLFFILIFSGAIAGAIAPPASGPQAPADQKVNPGNLFSAVMFGDTVLGRRWAALRPEAEKLFPAVKMKAVPDLHVTVIYIGPGWTVDGLPRLRQAMSVTFPETIRLTPVISTFGRNNQVVVVEFKGFPEACQAQIASVKAKLNEEGLKKPESGDAFFRPHVTIAEAKTNPPTEEQVRELAAFRDWIGQRLDLSTLDPVLGSQTPVRLMLADSTRPAPIPEYIEVESFLERYLRPEPVKKHPPSRP